MTSNSDTIDTHYKVALSMLKGVTSELLMELEEKGMSVPEFLESSDARLSALTARPPVAGLEAYSRRQAIESARAEMNFISRHNIRVLYIGDEEYPLRLSQIVSPPPVIYVLGECDLNSPHPVSMVGTRRMTPYGAEATKRITTELAGYFRDLMVVSGLAYGVDAVSHQTALQCGVKTVGVMAHGLDMIYPAQHRDLAKKIISSGGALISQYPSGVKPFRANFLERNRIVAGLSDATVVIESSLKGGAMSTARHAFEADRDVFALPGRATDPMSEGCNHLIRKQRANLITAAADLIEVTGWEPLGAKVNPDHRTLFPELDGEAKIIYDYLRFESEPVHTDQICRITEIPIQRLLPVINDLEFDGVLIRFPGNRFGVAR